MKLLDRIFPIRSYLSIFQLEEYDTTRFLIWVARNPKFGEFSEKKKFVFTFKAKIITAFSILIVLIVMAFVWFNTNSYWWAGVLGIVLLNQFYLPLAVARLIIYPLEYMAKYKIVKKAKQKLYSLKKVKVIGITGSYGKTSVKEILYQLIKDKAKTLRTPQSFNTPLGIAKVVEYELDNTYEYFICELAAYGPGDIKKLCEMVEPDFGAITGITTQHLERFKSLDKIVKTKFELFDFLKSDNKLVLNNNDENIQKESVKRKIGKSSDYIKTTKVKLSEKGSTFYLTYKGKEYMIKTNLFGFGNVENLVGAISIAVKLGFNFEYLLERAKDLNPVANRFVLKKQGKAIIVDNTFSSNEISFREMVESARALFGSKVLVTPGIVELGSKETQINNLLGKYSRNVFAKVVLVGKNKRTKSFAQGLGQKVKFIDDKREDYLNAIRELSLKYDWIFLENDLTQNY